MRRRWLLSVLLAVGCSGAYKPLDCTPRTVTPVGDLTQDVLGAWDAFGTDSRVVAVFHDDGGVTTVEEPNFYSPAGGAGHSPWSLDTDGTFHFLSQRWSASVSPAGLALSKTEGAVVHPPLTCNGALFE